MLNITGLPAFEDNYIWLIGRQGKCDVAAVDPGDALVLMNHLERHDLTLCAILITHHHRDHTGGIAALLKRYPVPVYGPALEAIAGVSHPLQQND